MLHEGSELSSDGRLLKEARGRWEGARSRRMSSVQIAEREMTDTSGGAHGFQSPKEAASERTST